MRRLIAIMVAAFAAAALSAPPVGAVTNGRPDVPAHTNVGDFILQAPGTTEWWIGCSGSLISVGDDHHAPVFLTAGHCVSMIENEIPAGTKYAVTFDADLQLDENDFVTTTNTIPVTGWSLIPAFTLKNDNHRDVGVLFLASAPPGLAPVTLPALGAAADVVGSDVVSVGYGANVMDRSPTSKNSTEGFTGIRTATTQRANGITPNWLSLQGDRSATCYGDSGGPQFTSSGVEVSITIRGSAPCRSMTKAQRLDLVDVQAWLHEQMS